MRDDPAGALASYLDELSIAVVGGYVPGRHRRHGQRRRSPALLEDGTDHASCKTFLLDALGQAAVDVGNRRCRQSAGGTGRPCTTELCAHLDSHHCYRSSGG